MADVHQLPPGVQRRKCPGCDYLMDQVRLELARLDFPCPRCGKHTLGEFVPDDTPPPTPPWPAKLNGGL